MNGGRTLTDATYTNTTGMTDESCVAFCTTGGFIFAGTEYAQECCEFSANCHVPHPLITYHSILNGQIISTDTKLDCGNYLAPGSSNATATDCNMACTGNSSEQCGGPNRLSLFWNGTHSSPPVANPGAGLWALLGCYT